MYMQILRSPPPLAVEVTVEQQRILYFSVEKSLKYVHLTSDGRCLQRFDRQNRPVPAENIIAAREESRSRDYDREFVDGISTGDLEVELLQQVAERIAPGFSVEKLLQYLGLAEYGPGGLRYRKASTLLFANDISRWHPRCQVRIVRIQGTELGVGGTTMLFKMNY